ncbi:MAG TPA: thioredoxin [Bacteroidales bacterium]|nr:thioredoxin [Bacteroidales bacterium]
MIKQINKKEFDTLVYNTEELNENTKELNFLGDKPVIIDFYAKWCGPCKATTPILEELAKEREDINIYKIDVDEERELSGMFGIRSIPTFLFIPLKSKPQAAMGAMTKENFNQAIKEILFENGIEDAQIIEDNK